jgi:non-ribosomal peptide synthetase component F
MYGPTEASMEATYWTCAPATCLIGRPIANVRAYVLDKQLQPTPWGLPGSCILGALV